MRSAGKPVTRCSSVLTIRINRRFQKGNPDRCEVRLVGRPAGFRFYKACRRRRRTRNAQALARCGLMRYNGYVRKCVGTGLLGVVAVLLIFGGAIATSISRIGESPAETKTRQYKDARRELSDTLISGGERPSVDGQLTVYQKELLTVGYWKSEPRQLTFTNETEPTAKTVARRAKRESSRDALSESADDASDRRLAIQARRQEMKKWTEVPRERRGQR